jgi:outer membrane receptor for ferrienterochelin and colicin
VTDDQGDSASRISARTLHAEGSNYLGFRLFKSLSPYPKIASAPHQILLTLAKLSETVEVTSERTQLEADTASVSEVVSEREMKAVPLRNEQFIDTLPLVPGVVRGPDGLINIKGARSNQSDLRVNASAVADPVTGEFGFRLPIDVIESVETFTNPYSAEFGNFSSGVTQIHTRTGEQQVSFQLSEFLSAAAHQRWVDRRFGFCHSARDGSGPIIQDKLFYVQSFEYKFVRTRVPVDTLPELKNDTKLESFDSFTQLDYELNPLHHLSATFSIFPEKNSFVGLNTFNAEETTHDFRQRGKFFSVSERAILGASLLETTYSVKVYDANVIPNGAGTMFLAPDFNSGGFFNRQDRESTFHQWNSTYSLAPIQARGRHTLRFGTAIKYNTFTGRNTSTPVEILSSSGTTLEHIEFAGDGNLSRKKTDVGAFIQDNWQPADGVSLQFGVRYDHDSAVRDNDNIAPRFGFAFSRLNNGRTVIRGGVGLFYSSVPINATVFEQMQQRVITNYDSEEETAGVPLLYQNTLRQGGLRTPYAASWNVEVANQITEKLVLRVGVQQRNGRQELVVDPWTLRRPNCCWTTAAVPGIASSAPLRPTTSVPDISFSSHTFGRVPSAI